MNREARQRALTLICPVRSGAGSALVSDLAELGERMQQGFRSLPAVHFARFLLLPGGGTEAELLFELGFDGSLEPLLAALWASAGGELTRVLQHCESQEPVASAAAFQRFVERHATRAEAAHTIHEQLTVSVIRNDARLNRLLQSELDRAQAVNAIEAHGPFEIASALQAHARTAHGTWLSRQSRDVRPAFDRLEPIRRRFLDVLLAVALLPLLEMGAWFASLTRRAQTPALGSEPSDLLRSGGALAQLLAVKPGRLRLFVLRLLLWLTHGWLAQRSASDGHALLHVHHLRWLLLPGPRLLLLGHADVGPAALLSRRGRAERLLSSLIWLQTVGFPGGFWATLLGSRREAALLAWLRGSLLASELWYSAYPWLTVGTIERNHRLSELLSRDLDRERAAELCALL
jgi:hypothetical protein